MNALGLAARFIHLSAGLGLVGLFTATLLAGRSNRPTALAWVGRMGSLTGWLTVALLLSGVAVLAAQVVVVAGHTHALLEPLVWLRLLTQSRFGTVWLIRHGVLLLLAALLLLRERERSAVDALVCGVEGWTLSAVAVAAMAWAGHAAALDSQRGLGLLADAVHLVAAGNWFGALLPLALLLRAAAAEAGADARPYAVLAIRRFSALALGAMLLITATGVGNAWVEVGSV